jgi:Macrocin-O-methyltransferase (TylF)
MKLTTIIRKFIESTGYTVVKMPKSVSAEAPYDQDGLHSIHNHDFVKDPSFCKAYDRACLNAPDYNMHWRIHIGLWAAFAGSKLDGDFVECGVNYGFLSSAIMEFLDWNSRNTVFYLLDTFEGIDPRYVSEEEYENGTVQRSEDALKNGFYVRGVESVKTNFSQWKNTRIIKGSIPETLNQVETRNIAYLHIDMNCSPPEVAAMNFFWDRLLPGAVILLDDYAYRGYELQKYALDSFAREKHVMIASLPTGQGLLIKPPERI